MAQQVSPQSGQQPTVAGRRGFMREVLAIVVGGIAVLTPLVAGLAVFLDPLRRRGKNDAAFVKVATLESLPVGIPQRFPVITDRVDAWNFFPKEPIGVVYLLRTESGEVRAFNAKCPHAGCLVAYEPGKELFRCPCHDSSFDKDGQIHNPNSPSPRPLDSLLVKEETTDHGTEVLVQYENFVGGVKKKTAIA